MNYENVSFEQIELLDGFWKNRFELNAEKSVYAVQKVFEESGRFDAVRFKASDKSIHFYYDSDVAKWIEAVAYLLEHDRKRFADLEKFCDELIDSMAQRQRADGYFNSYFLQVEPNKIYVDRSLHELYCAGHLIEAAVAYDKFTGKHKFLEFAEKMANGIDKAFRIDKSVNFVTCGHEEIELALFILYEYTKKTEYKELAEFFIDQRGNNKLDKENVLFSEIYSQEQVPVRQLLTAQGHAVRATYLCCAMADMVRISQDADMEKACLSIYEDMINRKAYVTGGIGSTRIVEAFTIDYDLPNLTAYSESCAAIGLMLFCLRLQKLGVKGSYADTVERVLYNAFLSSTSLDGKAFFYENPLEVCRKEAGKEIAMPEKNRTVLPIWRRKEVFDCSCCPPNINRFVASIENIILSKTENGYYVNQYVACKLKNADLRITTEYPLNGVVKIISNDYNYRKIFVRIPSWLSEYDFTLNGKPHNPKITDGYAEFDVADKFEIELKMEITPYFIQSNPKVRDNAGRVCLMNGAIVYCLEEVDNGGDLYSIFVDTKKPNFTQEFCKECGLPVIYCDAERVVSDKENSLYARAYPRRKQRVKFIPYFAFANREESDMLVWVNKT